MVDQKAVKDLVFLLYSTRLVIILILLLAGASLTVLYWYFKDDSDALRQIEFNQKVWVGSNSNIIGTIIVLWLLVMLIVNVLPVGIDVLSSKGRLYLSKIGDTLPKTPFLRLIGIS